MFLTAVKDGDARAALAATPDLDVTLVRLLGTGRAAWPTISRSISDEAFLHHLAERLPPGGEAPAALAATHGGDLYLACGCTGGDPQALAAFEKHFMAEVSHYLARSDTLPAFTDEVKQMLRARLLVAEGGLLPRIAGYTGRGPLGGWLRTAAARSAIDLRRSQRGGVVALEHDVLTLQNEASDPELGFLKTHAAAELKAAFETTLARLSPREANVLRLHFLDGVTHEAVAALYRVSVRTVERWTAQLRQKLLDETRRRLAERLRLPASQLDELIGLVQSRLHVSIRRFLNKSDE